MVDEQSKAVQENARKSRIAIDFQIIKSHSKFKQHEQEFGKFVTKHDASANERDRIALEQAA